MNICLRFCIMVNIYIYISCGFKKLRFDFCLEALPTFKMTIQIQFTLKVHCNLSFILVGSCLMLMIRGRLIAPLSMLTRNRVHVSRKHTKCTFGVKILLPGMRKSVSFILYPIGCVSSINRTFIQRPHFGKKCRNEK